MISSKGSLFYNVALPFVCEQLKKGEPTRRANQEYRKKQEMRLIFKYGIVGPSTSKAGSVTVPQYRSSKITVFVWGKNTILKFVGYTKGLSTVQKKSIPGVLGWPF